MLNWGFRWLPRKDSNLDKLIQRIQSLDAVIQQLSGAPIQFRISYDTGETQVALIETSADAAAGEK